MFLFSVTNFFLTEQLAAFILETDNSCGRTLSSHV